jgi:hypothetical protein
MVEKGYEVVWTKRSQKQMRQVFKHISKDSPKNGSITTAAIAQWKSTIIGWLIAFRRA